MDELAVRKSVERARVGDADAFSTLFQFFRSDVERLCGRLLASASEAEDAASETFLRSHRALDSYDSAKPFRPWLLAIAAHHCIDRLRRRSAEQRIFDPADYDPEQLAAPGRRRSTSACGPRYASRSSKHLPGSPIDTVPRWCCATTPISTTTPLEKSWT